MHGIFISFRVFRVFRGYLSLRSLRSLRLNSFVKRFWHPFRVQSIACGLPEVSTPLRPPATLCQPFGLSALRSLVPFPPVFPHPPSRPHPLLLHPPPPHSPLPHSPTSAC